MNPDHEPATREGDDPTLRRAFRFGGDETDWYRRLRDYSAGPALGRIGEY